MNPSQLLMKLEVRGRKKRNFKHKEFKPQGAHEIFAASHSPFVAAI